MKKAISVFILLIVSNLFMAFAAFENIDSLFKDAGNVIGGSLTSLLMAIAFILFVVAVISYLNKRRSGDDSGLKDARIYLLWSVIGLFVMVAVWGLVAFLENGLLSGSVRTIERPQSYFGNGPVGNNPNKANIQSPTQGGPSIFNPADNLGDNTGDETPDVNTSSLQPNSNTDQSISPSSGDIQPGQSCKVISGDCSNTECISGYCCLGSNGKRLNVGSSGTCQKFPVQNSPAASPAPTSNIREGNSCKVLSGKSTQCASGLQCLGQSGKAIGVGQTGICQTPSSASAVKNTAQYNPDPYNSSSLNNNPNAIASGALNNYNAAPNYASAKTSNGNAIASVSTPVSTANKSLSTREVPVNIVYGQKFYPSKHLTDFTNFYFKCATISCRDLNYEGSDKKLGDLIPGKCYGKSTVVVGGVVSATFASNVFIFRDCR